MTDTIQSVAMADEAEYELLGQAQKDQLRQWITENLEPAATPWLAGKHRGAMSSYGIKHVFSEHVAGPAGDGYVSNGEFKGAMLDAGYQPVDAEATNWVFRCRPKRGSRLHEHCYGRR